MKSFNVTKLKYNKNTKQLLANQTNFILRNHVKVYAFKCVPLLVQLKITEMKCKC